MTSVARKCEVSDCERPHIAKGLCTLHYNRKKRGTPLEAPVRKDPEAKGAKCSVEACDRTEVAARGLCGAHYSRLRKGQDLDSPVKTRVRWRGFTCAVRNCEEPAYSKEMCSRHYGQSARYNLSLERLSGLVELGTCMSCGDESPLAIDHDHLCCAGEFSCGNCVRGVLCEPCNIAIGLIDRKASCRERV